MSRFLHCGGWTLAFFAVTMAADAQFTVVGPPPFPETVAREKIRSLFEKVDASNRRQTLETITGWLTWYRNLVDEELIAAWQKDSRANLIGVMEPLADARVATAVVEFSWRQQRQAVFTLAYAPMLGDLMLRFADSAKPFLDDLLGPARTGRTLFLPDSQAEAVCRIFIDMPDVGTWRKDALRILPQYRRIAETLLNQDLRGGNREKGDLAQVWLRDLRMDAPDAGSEQPAPRRILSRPKPSSEDPAPPAHAQATSTPLQPVPAAPQVPATYDGARSGTLSCSGAPIPQNAEYVFRNMPLLKLQLDYDTKIWDARLVPGEGQTQKLILKNKGTGPQKRCVVHWSITP